MTLARGTRIGPYEVVALLGTGGMGEVYRAIDPRLGRDVAVKVLPQARQAGADGVARFEREARLLASINHPNIATIYGVEGLGGSTAIVMELVEGPSLADLIARGPIDVPATARIASQIADGMSSAHARGLVHRDLKVMRTDGIRTRLGFDTDQSVSDKDSLRAESARPSAATGEARVHTLRTAWSLLVERLRGR